MAFSCAVVYYAQVAHAFSAQIKCQHCTIHVVVHLNGLDASSFQVFVVDMSFVISMSIMHGYMCLLQGLSQDPSYLSFGQVVS